MDSSRTRFSPKAKLSSPQGSLLGAWMASKEDLAKLEGGIRQVLEEASFPRLIPYILGWVS